MFSLFDSMVRNVLEILRELSAFQELVIPFTYDLFERIFMRREVVPPEMVYFVRESLDGGQKRFSLVINEKEWLGFEKYEGRENELGHCLVFDSRGIVIGFGENVSSGHNFIDKLLFKRRGKRSYKVVFKNSFKVSGERVNFQLVFSVFSDWKDMWAEFGRVKIRYVPFSKNSVSEWVVVLDYTTVLYYWESNFGLFSRKKGFQRAKVDVSFFVKPGSIFEVEVEFSPDVYKGEKVIIHHLDVLEIERGINPGALFRWFSSFVDQVGDRNEVYGLGLEIFSILLRLVNDGVLSEDIFSRIKGYLEEVCFKKDKKGGAIYVFSLPKLFSWLTEMSSYKLLLAFIALRKELEVLGEKLRVLVILDHEGVPEGVSRFNLGVNGVLGVFEALLKEPVLSLLNPVLVTGRGVYVGKRFLDGFLSESREWLDEKRIDAVFTHRLMGDDYYFVSGRGRDWSTAVFVRFVTYLFDNGITKCLVGTKFLLGEGWDSLSVNTLIDLTRSVSGSIAVTQVKGRALRRDPSYPEKTANIYDVFWVEFLSDFHKADFEKVERKFMDYWGIDEKGRVRSGLGRLHSLLESKEMHARRINNDSFEMISRREELFDKWLVGRSLDILVISTRIPLDLPKRIVEKLVKPIISVFNMISRDLGFEDLSWSLYEIEESERGGTVLVLISKVRPDRLKIVSEKMLESLKNYSDWEYAYGIRVPLDKDMKTRFRRFFVDHGKTGVRLLLFPTVTFTDPSIEFPRETGEINAFAIDKKRNLFRKGFVYALFNKKIVYSLDVEILFNHLDGLNIEFMYVSRDRLV